MAQQRLRRHHDERLARVVLHLPAQRVEVLRGRRRIDHLHVPLGAQRQEALEARGRVLRSLSFVAVRQEHHQAAVLSPLLLGAEMNWSMMICAPFMKSPNCASHNTSAPGSATE